MIVWLYRRTRSNEEESGSRRTVCPIRPSDGLEKYWSSAGNFLVRKRTAVRTIVAHDHQKIQNASGSVSSRRR